MIEHCSNYIKRESYMPAGMPNGNGSCNLNNNDDEDEDEEI